MFEIKSWCCGEVLVFGYTIGQTLRIARENGISLAYADLSNTDLMDKAFSGLDLTGADLRNTKFDFSNFAGANFTDVIVNSSTRFTFCNMRRVNCTRVVFKIGNLNGAAIGGMFRDD